MRNERNQTVKKGFMEQATKFLKDKKRRRRLIALTGAIAILVAFTIGNMNIKPAISMTDGEIHVNVVNNASALTGEDARLLVQVDARAGRNSDTRFVLKTDANGADLSDQYVFTKTEYTDAEGNFRTEDGKLLTGGPALYSTTIIDDNGREIELTRDDADERGVVEYAFVLPAENSTSFTLEFAEGTFSETVEERFFTVEVHAEEEELVDVVEEEIVEEATDTEPVEASDAEATDAEPVDASDTATTDAEPVDASDVATTDAEPVEASDAATTDAESVDATATEDEIIEAPPAETPGAGEKEYDPAEAENYWLGLDSESSMPEVPASDAAAEDTAAGAAIEAETQLTENKVNNAAADVVTVEEVTAVSDEEEAVISVDAAEAGSTVETTVEEETDVQSTDVQEETIPAPAAQEESVIEINLDDVIETNEEQTDAVINEEIVDEVITTGDATGEELLDTEGLIDTEGLTEEEELMDLPEEMKIVELQEKVYTLSFESLTPVEEPVQTVEAQIVSDVIIMTEMTYLFGTAPETEDEYVVLSWTTEASADVQQADAEAEATDAEAGEEVAAADDASGIEVVEDAEADDAAAADAEAGEVSDAAAAEATDSAAEATTVEQLLQRSAFFKRSITATVYEDETYQNLSDDTALITVDGAMPEDVIALAYPMPVEEPEISEDSDEIYEVVCTYDISLFRSLVQVRVESGETEGEMLSDEIGAASDPNAVKVGKVSVDTGSVDESVKITIDGKEYVKYEPTAGNFMTVRIESSLIGEDNGSGYEVLRTEDIGVQTQMETIAGANPAEEATGVSFYTDHFTPYSVVRSTKLGDLVYINPESDVDGNGTKDSPYSKNQLGTALNAVKYGGRWNNAFSKTLVFMGTLTIDEAFVNEKKDPNNGLFVFPDFATGTGHEEYPGQGNGPGWKANIVRYYEGIDTGATETESGMRKPIFRIAEGVDVRIRNLDIDGAGVQAVSPLIVVDKNATLKLDNSYLHHGYNIADPKNENGVNEFTNGVFGRGGGINVADGGSVTLENTTIDFCKAMHGGGIYSKGSNSSITLNDKASVSNNDVNNDFTTSYKGGGPNVKHHSTGQGTAQGEVVYYQPRMGGGIALYDGSLTINDGAAIDKNGAFYGGGVYAEGSAKVMMNGGSVSGNTTGAKIENGKRVTGDDPNTVYSPYSLPAGGGIMFANATYIDPDGYFVANPRQINANPRSNFNNVDGAVIHASLSNIERPRAAGKYSFTMTGGSIDNNTNYGFEGGGVIFSPREVAESWSCAAYNTNNLPLASISGGSISGNKTKRIGGGIYCGWVDLSIIADEGKVVNINNNETTGMSELEQNVDRFNTGYNGGGMFIYAGSKVRVYDAIVTENTTTHVNDWTDVEARSAGNKYMRGDGQWNGGGGIASCKTSVTKFNNNRGVAVFDNTIKGGVSTKLDGSTGQSYAHGTDLMLVAESQGANQSLDYYHNTYMAIDMTGGGQNVFTFDNINQVQSQYYKDKIPEHEQFMPHGTNYASQNILPVKLLDGNDGLSIQVLNHPTDADKKLAHDEARVQFIGNKAYTKGGGIANNGELTFGANSHAIQLFKVDGENPSTFLAGAIFTLTKVRETRDMTEVYSVSKQAPADGKIVFWDLAEGKYNITETVAPQGYTPRAKVWQIWVKNDGIYQNMNGQWIKLDSEKELGPMDPDTGVIPQLFTLRDDDNEKKIKNYESELATKVTVNKNWLDADGNPLTDDKKQEITVELYGGPSLAEQTALGQTVVLNAENNWTASFENLPVFWGNEKDGIACVYTVHEVAMDFFEVIENFHYGEWVKTDKIEYGKLYVLKRDGGGALSGKTDAQGVGLTGWQNVGEDMTFDPNTTKLADMDKNAVWTVSKNQTSKGSIAYRLKTLGDGRILGSEPNGSFRKASIQTAADGSGNDAVQIVDGKTLVFNDTWKFCQWQNGEGFRLRTSGGTPSSFSLYYWDSGTVATIGSTGEWMSVNTIEYGKPYVFTMPGANAYNQSTGDDKWILRYDANMVGSGGEKGFVLLEQFDPKKSFNEVLRWVPEDAGNGNFYLRAESTGTGNGLYLTAGKIEGGYMLRLGPKSQARVLRFKDGALQMGDGTQYLYISVVYDSSGKTVERNVPELCYAGFKPHIYTEATSEIMGFQYDITNKEKPGYVMPATGGMGTHWFYILGFGILAVLGVVLYNRRFD